MIHPGYNQNSPKQIIGILRDAGADLERTIMCHIPRTLFDLKSYLKVAEAGGYLEWDLFGREPYPFHSYGYAGCLPGPAEQIDDILELMARGYEKLDKPVAV